MTHRQPLGPPAGSRRSRQVRAAADAPVPLGSVIPAPASVRPDASRFTLTRDVRVRVPQPAGGAREAAHQVARLLRPATGFDVPVTPEPGRDGVLLLPGGPPELGEEGYRLRISGRLVVLRAHGPAGFFHGLQTLRQLLPDAIESDTPQPGPWQLAGGTVTDRPRFGHRGAMLDVSRHFLPVDEVKRRIDQFALYKLNRLHLHLTDDQGWRIAIDAWPRLAEHGGSTQVGGGPGGYYTKADYREIVRYAAERHLSVVPEIDMPGHTNAALASYPELNGDGVAPPLHTGTEVGFSSLCVPKDVTYDVVDDVLREIAELTPGPYLHIGGDEAQATSAQDYAAFMARAQAMVAKHGKTVVGWHQLAGAAPAEGAVLQYSGTGGEEEDVVRAARGGAKVVMSPADRAYLDMKYTEDTPYGLSWAGLVEVRDSYEWDPAGYLPDVGEESVLGVEAALWSETLETAEQADFLTFPRLPGIAELGWSPKEALGWDGHRQRLADHAPRWDALGISYYRSPQVPWRH